MPKVSQEYMDKKREMIVEAAYKVCLRKPVQMVNITDVIAETGMSQGAIYRYYASLDDILIDLVSKMRADYNIVDRLNEITSDPDAPFEETTFKVCDCLGEAMEKHLMDVQKINFDLVVLAINEPKRVSYIMENPVQLSKKEWSEFLEKVDKDTYKVDLDGYVVHSLKEIGIVDIKVSDIDTYSNDNYFSNYKENKFNLEKGRFIVGAMLR